MSTINQLMNVLSVMYSLEIFSYSKYIVIK